MVCRLPGVRTSADGGPNSPVSTTPSNAVSFRPPLPPFGGVVWDCPWPFLLDYIVFTVLIFYILTIAGVFILRRTRPDISRPYKAFGYPVLPLLYIVLASVLCVSLLIYKPAFTFPGLGIVLLGIPVYYLFGNKHVIEEAP